MLNSSFSYVIVKTFLKVIATVVQKQNTSITKVGIAHS